MNKNGNLFELDILPGTNLRSASGRTCDDFNIDSVYPRYKTCFIDWTSRIRFSSLSSRFESVVSARNNCLAGPMHKTRRDRRHDAQEEVRVWHSNGPGLLSVSRRCRYIKAEVLVLDFQARMCGDVEVRNQCL